MYVPQVVAVGATGSQKLLYSQKDYQALQQQVEERKAAEQAEKDMDKAYGAFMISRCLAAFPSRFVTRLLVQLPTWTDCTRLLKV